MFEDNLVLHCEEECKDNMLTVAKILSCLHRISFETLYKIMFKEKQDGVKYNLRSVMGENYYKNKKSINIAKLINEIGDEAAIEIGVIQEHF